MSLVSSSAVRELTLADLKLKDLIDPQAEGQSGVSVNNECQLEQSDTILANVRQALKMGYAGIILSGPPGTGKSWYAQQIAVALSGTWDTVRSVQFHPSYQYEDFVFGYTPKEGGGFALHPKEFARICKDAAATPDDTHVLIIDEISRSDVVRVFGEALTYIEVDKRDQPFQLASGQEMSVPKNLVLIGTMNPWDKGVDELDIALERRFAQIDIEPSADVLRRLILRGGASADFSNRIVDFFTQLQDQPIETVRLGHAYFLRCLDEESARFAWALRIRPSLRRACRLNQGVFNEIEAAWNKVFRENVALADENGGEGSNSESSNGDTGSQ